MMAFLAMSYRDIPIEVKAPMIHLVLPISMQRLVVRVFPVGDVGIAPGIECHRGVYGCV
jgi:hypothetical protein